MNYVQEFEAKRAALPALPRARFHLIGRLQSNKAKRAAGLFARFIRSTASSSPVGWIARTSSWMCFWKSSSATKRPSRGCPQRRSRPCCAAVESAPSLRLAGLMTMPPWHPDPERSRPYFRQLRELAEAHGVRRSVHGHEPGLGSRDRRGSDTRARRHGDLRRAQSEDGLSGAAARAILSAGARHRPRAASRKLPSGSFHAIPVRALLEHAELGTGMQRLAKRRFVAVTVPLARNRVPEPR